MTGGATEPMEQPATRDMASSKAGRSSSWFNDVVNVSRGKGELILAALGIDDVAAAMNGRHWLLPGCQKKKARLSDREKGAGGCDCGCRRRWGDWIGLAKIIKGSANMGESARWVADVIGHEIPQRKEPGRPSGAKTNPARSLSPLPQDGTYPPAEDLVEQWCKRKRGPSLEACRKIGCKVALYRCKTESKSHHGKDKWESLPVLAFPVWGEGGPDAGPVNYRVVRLDGELLPTFDRSGTPDAPAKIKTIGGGPKGLLGPVDLMKQWCEGTLSPECQIWKLEGESDVLTLLAAGVPDNVLVVTNNHGCRDCNQPAPIVNLFRGRMVWVIHDADDPGQFGAIGWCKLLAPVASEVRNVTLPYAVEQTHGKDIRDYLTSGGTVQTLIERAAEAKPVIAFKPDDRERIELTNNERKTVDQIILALKNEPNLYVRGGHLVDAIELPHPDGRPDEFTLQVRPKPLHDLRTTITSHAHFYISTEEGPQPRSITQTLTAQVAAAGSYPDIRPLRGVIEHFFLRSDGSVCTENGYDPATQMLLRSTLQAEIPGSPTKEDATEAMARLLDLVSDFPFAKKYHRSAWIAGLLTLFARPAINGTVPFQLIEASMQGSGKTRLIDLAMMIAIGRSLARNAWPGQDEEVSKLLTAICLAGLPVVVFDNCKTILGGQAIEGIATSASWQGRILGESRQTPEMPMRTVFWFTANNASLTLDFARRACVCRLEPETDRPDERSDFRHNDLLGYAREHRAQLAKDALVILRAFRISGAKPEMPPWGGFEAWSDLIRGALLWLGQEDPYQGTIDAKRSEASEDILPALIEALTGAGMPMTEVGMPTSSWTVGEIKAEADKRFETGYGNWAPLNPALVDVLQSAAGDKKLTAQRLGKILHRYDGRIYDGKQFFSEFDSKKKQKRWAIRLIAAGSAGSGGYSEGLSNNGGTENKNTEPINNFQNGILGERHDSPPLPALPADRTSRLPVLVSRLLNAGCGIFIDPAGELAFDPADGHPSPAASLSSDDRLSIADWLFSAPSCSKCGSRRPSAPAGAPGIYCGMCGTRLLGVLRRDVQHQSQSIVT